MLLLLYLRTVIHYLVLFFPDYYISELLLSFLPYSMVGHYIAISVCMILIIRRRRKLSKVHRLGHFCLYALIYLAYLHTTHYLHTYSSKSPPIPPYQTRYEAFPDATQPLSFFYANILYTNKNMSWLLKTIQQSNPDVIMMVEYTAQQDKILRPQLVHNYPYTSRYQPRSGKNYDGDIIYSRYPLKKIDTHDSPRAYNHVIITKQRRPYHIILVHTAAPVSLSFWKLRKRQMDAFATNIAWFLSGNNAHISDSTAIFGDFNITPRVHDYQDFDARMNALYLQDVTTNSRYLDTTKTVRPYTLGQGGITTRWHQLLSPARAHIDHFRVGSRLNPSYSIIAIPGSDHDGFRGTLDRNI